MVKERRASYRNFIHGLAEDPVIVKSNIRASINDPEDASFALQPARAPQLAAVA